MRSLVHFLIVCGLASSLMGASVENQTSSSASMAAVLTRLLDARGLDVVAARDPDAPNTFVAALYLPGSQLLVVSAEYPVPMYMEQHMQRGELRELYVELQGTPSAATRFFIHDLEANGLHAARVPGQPFDVVYEGATQQTTFNGNWAGQGLTQSEYERRFADADARYAHMLAVLAAALKPET